jgi:site-specific DNA-cytosine methylase
MHALLWATQRKRKRVHIVGVKKRRRRKVVPQYDTFRESRKTS